LKEVFNSDAKKFNGTGDYHNKKVTSEELKWNFREHSVELTLPPLGLMVFKYL
jgi:1,4-alpha-glucan branching enzyme